MKRIRAITAYRTLSCGYRRMEKKLHGSLLWIFPFYGITTIEALPRK